jgi:hypothetical protein
MSNLQTGSSYEVKNEGGATIFLITPSPKPTNTVFFVFAAVFLLIGIPMVFDSSLWAGGLFFFVPLGLLMVWWGLKDLRPKRHRGPSTFRIENGTLHFSNQSISVGDIHQILVNNELEDRVVSTTIIVGRPHLGTVANDIGRQAGAAVRAKLAASSHSLELEAGGKRHFLAGGMDEVTSRGLLFEVSKRLGFQVQV